MSQNQFLYNCTQNQFTVQVYTKLVYWLIMNGMYMDRTFSCRLHKDGTLHIMYMHTDRIIYSLYRDRTLELGTDSETVRLTNERVQIYKCTNGMHIGQNLHLHYYE